jgi:hypothetical protein
VRNISGTGRKSFRSRSIGRLLIYNIFINLYETSMGPKENSFILGNNIEVCRYFCRVASEIKERKCNSACNYVLSYRSKMFISLCGDHAALGKINSEHIMTSESKIRIQKRQSKK